MSKTTPKYASGPWYAFAGYDAENPEYTVEGPESTLAFIRPSTSNPNPEATANLIAAAPDLLEALQRIMDIDCPLTGNPTYLELVKYWEHEKSQGRGEANDRLFALAAIAKATGEIK